MKQLKQFRHFILTRYNNGLYDNENAEQWMKDRFKLFKKTRESILKQDGDFEWVISIDERTPQEWFDKIFTDDRMSWTTKDFREYFDHLTIDEPWVITSRIDNDDIYLDGFVKAVQEQFKPEIMAIDIDYFQFYNGCNYTSERHTATSPFISLVEPSNRIKSVYCRPHYKLVSGYPISDTEKKIIPSVKLTEQYALMVIHESNMANKLVGKKV